MGKRIELKEDEMDQVVGGQFHYNTHTNEDGTEYMTCRVDGAGTYYCSENAKRNISLFFMNNPDAPLEAAIDYAFQKGYFWN